MPPRPAKEIFATSGKEPWDISTILTLWYGDPQYGSFGKDLARVVSAVRLLLADVANIFALAEEDPLKLFEYLRPFVEE